MAHGDKFYLFVDTNGLVFPCCGFIEPKFFYQHGWPKIKAAGDLRLIYKKAKEFCYTCPVEKKNEVNTTILSDR